MSGPAVSIFAVSSAPLSLPALSAAEQETAWAPSLETSNVQLPRPAVIARVVELVDPIDVTGARRAAHRQALQVGAGARWIHKEPVDARAVVVRAPDRPALWGARATTAVCPVDIGVRRGRDGRYSR